MENETYLTAELCARFKCCLRTLQSMVAAGELQPPTKIGKKWVWSKRSADAYEAKKNPGWQPAPDPTWVKLSAIADAGVPFKLEIDFDLLLDHLPVQPGELPAMFEKIFGEQLTKGACYAWFARQSITAERLAQLLVVVRLTKGVTLDFWRYIVTQPNPSALSSESTV